MLHQTIVGLEAKKQLKKIGEYPDIIIGCAGGGSNLPGLRFLLSWIKSTGNTLKSIRLNGCVPNPDAGAICL